MEKHKASTAAQRSNDDRAEHWDREVTRWDGLRRYVPPVKQRAGSKHFKKHSNGSLHVAVLVQRRPSTRVLVDRPSCEAQQEVQVVCKRVREVSVNAEQNRRQKTSAKGSHKQQPEALEWIALLAPGCACHDVGEKNTEPKHRDMPVHGIVKREELDERVASAASESHFFSSEQRGAYGRWWQISSDSFTTKQHKFL